MKKSKKYPGDLLYDEVPLFYERELVVTMFMELEDLWQADHRQQRSLTFITKFSSRCRNLITVSQAVAATYPNIPLCLGQPRSAPITLVSPVEVIIVPCSTSLPRNPLENVSLCPLCRYCSKCTTTPLSISPGTAFVGCSVFQSELLLFRSRTSIVEVLCAGAIPS